ncbi:MAG: flagellar hook assembly protein FlgD [Rhodospirillales bacterium]
MALFSGVEADSGAAVGTAAHSQAKLQKDLNRFLSLLVTQLKHQDPLDPMDANEFTSQLVEFASVEQQIKQNTHLENMLRLQETGQVANMVTYIGTKIEASGQNFMLKNSAAKVAYTLPEDTAFQSVTMVIKDAEGGTVYRETSKKGSPIKSKSGRHVFEWDGQSTSGLKLKDGKYSFEVSATDNQGKLTKVGHSVFGVVTGMAAEDGVLQMYMDDVKVPFANVLSVHKGEDEVAAAPAAPAADPDEEEETEEAEEEEEEEAEEEQEVSKTVQYKSSPDTATREYTFDETTVTAPKQPVVQTVTDIPGEDTVVTTTPVTATTSVVIP